MVDLTRALGGIYMAGGREGRGVMDRECSDVIVRGQVNVNSFWKANYSATCFLKSS